MASDDLFLAFYAKTREEDLIQHIQSYHARGGDLNIRDKTGWGFLNVLPPFSPALLLLILNCCSACSVQQLPEGRSDATRTAS